MLEWIAGAALFAWCGLLLTPWQAWRNREHIDGSPAPGSVHGEPGDLSDLTVLIPARNEAEGIVRTLSALLPLIERGANVRLVDDESTDNTVAIVETWIATYAVEAVEVQHGESRPSGWSGKLWALEQGLPHCQRSNLLLLDADIEVDVGVIVALHRKLRNEQRAFVSVMATMPVETPAQRLLLPAFVWFFRMLYPFALANDSRSRVAAAAGGCILVRRSWMAAIGGYRGIQGELIDDCALARAIKVRGGRGWIGLSSGVRSHRGGEGIAAIGAMIARNAFTQLRHSWLLLLLCTAVMLIVFLGPLLVLAAGEGAARWMAAVAYLTMVGSYVPMLAFYRIPLLWALALPVTGLFYLAMTWQSALLWLQGVQSSWRGRSYAAEFASRSES